MFNSIFDTSAVGLSITNALICAGVALVLGLTIAITHKITSQTNKGFLTTLAVLPLLVMAVMIMINGNLGTSIAILGAFSLIRFRSIQGRAKDLLSVFFAMMVGLALGMGHVLFAVVITAIAIFAIVFFTYTNILNPDQNEKILKITIPEDLDYDDAFNEVFKKYCKKVTLMRMKTVNMGSLYDLTYNVKLKSGIREKDFLDAIRVKNCNLKVLLSQPVMEEDM
jgi:uncharacterized membrane protein YhiD involved in acid resistance